MKTFKKKLYYLIFLLLTYNSFFYQVNSEISNKILVKVGSEIITSLDLQNEILTNLVINKKEINQQNIDQVKDYSIKNLINLKIKLIEINKYEIKNYNKNDLNNYLSNIALNNLNSDISGLKLTFKNNSINFESFQKKLEVELLWKTLIFDLYKNQTNINLIELENELAEYKNNKNIEEFAKIKEKLIIQKKQEKLDLFSRSHFSKIENLIKIDFL